MGEQVKRWTTGRWREERPKREIVTTKLVAGADFFHHLPCVAGRRLEDWERVRVNPRPQHPTNKECIRELHFKAVVKKSTLGFSCPITS